MMLDAFLLACVVAMDLTASHPKTQSMDKEKPEINANFISFFNMFFLIFLAPRLVHEDRPETDRMIASSCQVVFPCFADRFGV